VQQARSLRAAEGVSLVDGSKNIIKIGAGTYAAGVSIHSNFATTVYGQGATLTGNISLTSGATVKLLGISSAGRRLVLSPLATNAPMPTFHLEDVSSTRPAPCKAGRPRSGDRMHPRSPPDEVQMTGSAAARSTRVES